jgi:hypothetical protein
MSSPYEVIIEPLVSDGSNFVSWSSQVLNILKTIGLEAENILVESILPLNFDIDHFDWRNMSQRELECSQLNSCVTNLLKRSLCKEIQETIFEMKEIRDDAHHTWITLKDVYGESKRDDCNARVFSSK